jgi:TrmH family RNA methyltransferase
MIITSRDNSLLRQARAVRDGKVDGLIFIEGLRLCEEALHSDLSLEAVIFSEEIARKERAASVIAELSRVADRVAAVSEKLLESISYTKTPQGIVVIGKRPDTSEARLAEAMNETPLLLVMHEINNPVNVGAILRTAEAAGATGAIALRGAMGSAFRIPIWNGAPYREAIEWCNGRELFTIGADARATASYTDVNWDQGCALILGPESAGLSPDELSAARQTVSVPMYGQVESLNVSVAAGILLYEAARQRRRAT